MSFRWQWLQWAGRRGDRSCVQTVINTHSVIATPLLLLPGLLPVDGSRCDEWAGHSFTEQEADFDGRPVLVLNRPGTSRDEPPRIIAVGVMSVNILDLRRI